MPHGGDKRAVQMPRGAVKTLSSFLRFWAYFHSNESQFRPNYVSDKSYFSGCRSSDRSLSHGMSENQLAEPFTVFKES